MHRGFPQSAQYLDEVVVAELTVYFSGITGALTATGATTGTVLAEATNSVSQGTPSLNGIATGAAAVSTTSSPSISTAAASSSSSSSSSGNSSISMSTVIGACVGALVGVLVLVLLALWLYKRTDPIKKRRPNTRAGPGLQPNWNKLGDDEDKWESMDKKTETIEIAPMEKLTMFKKTTPSIRTAYTAKTEELPAFDFGSHPFSQYHPNLAKELASADEPPVPPFTHKTDSSAVSWDGDTIGGASFLSARSKRVSGAMSPTIDIARPTPALTNSEPHRWESAEVINLEGHVAEIIDPQDIENPFEHAIERRKSQHNPFFGSTSSSALIAKVNKGKGKAREIMPLPPIPISNPFADDGENTEKTPTRPTFSHQVVGSMSSVTSNDRAIQSLIAALGTTPEEVQARLKVAEPSLASDAADSIYTSAEYNSEDEDAEEDVTNSFPLPPGSDHSGHSLN
ncbi:hypothetical protein J3R30DRAFT_3764173 [Lentinula aciculospora]|uniref:Uncharacterized protein n=1 Tax=Lentinula aciculospora TaxID=153920 RepID=A0A9W9DLJ6_9AGAR|nr:hypothetical protein J3R30DRAFT_3764173 [Lentinula aciculospora]